MNKYKKFCPNVFVAKCEEEHQKGDIIVVETRYGKENEHIVHNFVGMDGDLFLYSITRADGFDSRERAKNKVDKLNDWADSAERRAEDWREKSNEGADFLRLGEPIKIGHHSERRHRALIERNHGRMSNAMKELDKADAYRDRTNYWEGKAEEINLSMPESLEYFQVKLEEAKARHKGLKDGSIQREHSYSLTYANKAVKDLEAKVKIAKKLWA